MAKIVRSDNGYVGKKILESTIFKPPQYVRDMYPYFYYTEIWKDFKYRK